MRELSRPRRFAVALFTLFCAATLFRSNVASALMIRGDGYLYRGEQAQALQRYRRALLLSPALEVAADRFVFVSLERQTPQSLRQAIAVANRYLHRNPNDAAVLSDRALCYLHLHRYALAQRDFEQAATISGTPSTYVFAGWAAQHAGRQRRALELWRRALRLRPGYRPALIALSEHPG